MLRFILVAIFLLLYFLLGIPVLGILWLIGKVNKRSADLAALRIVQWGFKVILKISGVEVTVIGEDRVPDEPVLYVGNHRSYFDILLTYSRCKHLTGYVAKKEMERFPLLNNWMRNLYCLFLDRDNLKEGLKTILTGIDYIKQGISICIFPEGTRNTGEELSMLPFKDGALKIADKTGCAIVPISMNNTAEIFENHLPKKGTKGFPKIRKTHVIIEYGKPIYPHTLDREERKHLGAYCQNIIQETINKNAALLESVHERG